MATFQDGLKIHNFLTSVRAKLDFSFNIADLDSMAMDVVLTSGDFKSAGNIKMEKEPVNTQLVVTQRFQPAQQLIQKHGGELPPNAYKALVYGDFFTLNKMINQGKNFYGESRQKYNSYKKQYRFDVKNSKTEEMGQRVAFLTTGKIQGTVGVNFALPFFIPDEEKLKQYFNVYKSLKQNRESFTNFEVVANQAGKRQLLQGDVTVPNIGMIGRFYFLTFPLPPYPVPKACTGADFDTAYKKFGFNKFDVTFQEIEEFLGGYLTDMREKLEEGCEFKLKIRSYATASKVTTTFVDQQYNYGRGNEALAKSRATNINLRTYQYIKQNFSEYIQNGQLVLSDLENGEYKMKAKSLPSSYGEGFDGSWVTGDAFYPPNATSPEAQEFAQKWRNEEGKLKPEAQKYFSKWQRTILRIEYVNQDKNFNVIKN